MFELRLVKTATDVAAARRLAREAQWLRELGDVRSLEGQLPRLIEQGIDARAAFLVIGIQPGLGDARLHRRPCALPRHPRQGALSCRRVRGLRQVPVAAAGAGRAAGEKRALGRGVLRLRNGAALLDRPYVLSQGDCAPWNIRRLRPQLLSRTGATRTRYSPLDDVLHYLMVQRRLKSLPLLRLAMTRAQTSRASPTRSGRGGRGDRRADPGLPARRDPAPARARRPGGRCVLEASGKTLAWVPE